MKHRIISLLLTLAMCLSLCVPVFAYEETEPSTIETQEIWHPANGVMPLEDNDGCEKGHRPPRGYVYQGYSEGNTIVDTAIQSGVVSIMSFIPGIGTIVSVIDNALTIEWLLHAVDEGRLRTNYFKYVYMNPNTGATYTHVIWVYTADDGYDRQLACEVYNY